MDQQYDYEDEDSYFNSDGESDEEDSEEMERMAEDLEDFINSRYDKANYDSQGECYLCKETIDKEDRAIGYLRCSCCRNTFHHLTCVLVMTKRSYAMHRVFDSYRCPICIPEFLPGSKWDGGKIVQEMSKDKDKDKGRLISTSVSFVFECVYTCMFIAAKVYNRLCECYNVGIIRQYELG